MPFDGTEAVLESQIIVSICMTVSDLQVFSKVFPLDYISVQGYYWT